ncbi:MAG: 4-oxalomesaconate tautomerase [Pseudomonadota bacterium]
MPLRSLPCLFMRGGTSRGPYFLKSDLPSDTAERDRVLLSAMGSPDTRQIDGLGGATTMTSKVAIVSKSERPDVDLDYLFAQVDIENALVDTSPSCGNMLSGVAPFALETGLMTAGEGETRAMIFNENTGSRIEAIVQSPGGAITYDGDTAIDGVPGTAAPIVLNFLDVVGGKTGAMFPTGTRLERIGGFDVTCIDVAMPMVMFRATDLGLSGHETREELEADPEIVAVTEPVRREAGRLMGLGDVADLVIPKVGLLSEPRGLGDIASRYLTPLKVHPAHAVTGAVCVATALSMEGTVANALASRSEANPRDISIAHPSGSIDVRLALTGTGDDLTVASAGLVRTARPIMRGEVLVRV